MKVIKTEHKYKCDVCGLVRESKINLHMLRHWLADPDNCEGTFMQLPVPDTYQPAQVIPFDKEGGEFFASSYADGGTVIWLLERCKKQLLTEHEE